MNKKSSWVVAAVLVPSLSEGWLILRDNPKRKLLQSQARHNVGMNHTNTVHNDEVPGFGAFEFDDDIGIAEETVPSSSSSSSTRSLLSRQRVLGRNPNDILTVADLDKILKQQGLMLTKALDNDKTEAKKKTRSKDKSPLPTAKRPAGSVAFPQPSVLSYRDVKFGTTVASALLGSIAFASVSPNLWLLGLLLGSVFGYETGRAPPDTVDGYLQKFVLRIGRRLAKVYLKLFDFLQTFFFMYKTGQLSYEYYKRYERIDERWGLTQKMDAWNARFVENKLRFDQWEKSNEVGRKVLAALRTAWLVEETRNKSRSIRRRQSRIRVVQMGYNVVGSMGQVVRQMRQKLLTSSQSPGNRVAGALVAVVTVTLVGALFTLSPLGLAALATVFGFFWPTWISTLLDRVGTQSVAQPLDTKPKAAMIVPRRPQRPTRKPLWYDQRKYHYFRRSDGSSQFYRVGQPGWFTPPLRPEPKPWLPWFAKG